VDEEKTIHHDEKLRSFGKKSFATEKWQCEEFIPIVYRYFAKVIGCS
jgi:hypothetical protein